MSPIAIARREDLLRANNRALAFFFTGESQQEGW
jgi:hypothetical protein